MSDSLPDAPGSPGIPPRWTSSAKSGVGTALSRSSRVWFTLSHATLNEVYYPRVDNACTRDLEFLVTDGESFFSEEKRDTVLESLTCEDNAPAFRIVCKCRAGKYRIEKRVVSDPLRDALLLQVRFEPLIGSLADYQVYVLLAPHLNNHGAGNTAWVGDYKSTPMLYAGRDGAALALACSTPWKQGSAGYVGFSDGWRVLKRDKRLSETWSQASDGNVALTGQVDLAATPDGKFTLALGFGQSAAEAGHHALASLQHGFDRAWNKYVDKWRQWHETITPLDENGPRGALYRVSATVLRTHESKQFPGGVIASLSVPWGMARGDDDLGGYHLVWPRDLIETAGGLLAAGASKDAIRVLEYLQATQEGDGHWKQNNWLDGSPYWEGVQMDEVALPVLFVDLLRRELSWDAEKIGRFWPMARQAAGYVARNGPVTQQDRWEEDPGYSPFTLAAEIAALLAAADLADLMNEDSVGRYLRETADAWQACVDHWVYATGGDLAESLGVEGYYVRIAPPETSEAPTPTNGRVAIKNRPPGQSEQPAICIVSPDALALVRFGLRAADDPRIVNTVKVIDALLKTDFPSGPGWRRYNHDGYGEHEDGSPFDGTGVGRVWPLLTGERAHYELAAGRRDAAKRLTGTFESFANVGGLLPEQVWDASDIPEKELFFGQPSGSAMPLVWAHSEYVKLLRSLRDGRVFDMPPQPYRRYVTNKQGSPHCPWRFNHKRRRIPCGKTLRIETLRPVQVHFSLDDWDTTRDASSRDTGLGIHVTDLPTENAPQGTVVRFTLYWTTEDRWEGQDFAVTCE